MMGAGARDIAALARAELERPPPPDAALLAERIRARHGEATAAVVFYGSCLRRATPEGVLDFYALVDSYRAAYASRRLALANALLPPNVFYLEARRGGERLRAKVAVVSVGDFGRAAAGRGLRSGIWARFCQPALAVQLRDAPSRDALVDAVVEAHLTAVRRVLPLLPEGERVGFEALWQRVFRETYAGEMRPEADAAIEKLYAADPARYDRAGASALRELAERSRGELRVELLDGGFRAWLPARRRARIAWRLRRPAAKLAYAAQLVKTAFTFGEWLPYALWKLERHTGTRIEPSERQRRHPLIFGWPILWRVLARRELR
jgi:hypothetical protein